MKRPANATQLVLPRVCEECGGKLFWPSRSDKRFCSGACRVKNWKKKNAS